MKRLIEVEFDLGSRSRYLNDPWGRIDCALHEIAHEIRMALSEGYKIPTHWDPPVITLTLKENPVEVELDELKHRAKNLRDQIRRKERTEP